MKIHSSKIPPKNRTSAQPSPRLSQSLCLDCSFACIVKAMEQQRRTHPSILNAIERRLSRRDAERHQLRIIGGCPDRHSLEYLVHFLDNDDAHEVVITQLDLHGVRLYHRSDGGLDVLRSFFSRSDTTLTKVTLRDCNLGSQEDALRLLSNFERNRTITDLGIHQIYNLQGGAALGNCLSGILQNMSHLQRFDLSCCNLRNDGAVRAMQSGLCNNRTLKQLALSCCEIENEGIRLLVNALVANTMMEVLDISYNEITSKGLDDITRLIESTRLQGIHLQESEGVFSNVESVQRFVAKLIKNTTIQVVLGINAQALRNQQHIDSITTRNIICARNKSLAHVGLLLAPLPPPPTRPTPTTTTHQHQHQHQPRNSNTTNKTNTMMMWNKTCHKAVAKFALVSNNAGASAIFKLLQARPALLEKHLKKPRPPAAATTCTLNPSPSSPKRKSCAAASTTGEQALKKTHHAGDGADVDAYFPTRRQEVVNTTTTSTTTTTSPSTTIV